MGSVRECGEHFRMQVPQMLANTAMVHMLIFFRVKGPLSLKTVSSVSPEQSYGKDEQSQKQDLSGGGNEKQEKSLFL